MLNTMYTSFIRAMSNIYMPPDEAEFFRDVGIKIARLRKELGLTQTELGQKIGVQQQVIASYEIGRRRIRPSPSLDWQKLFSSKWNSYSPQKISLKSVVPLQNYSRISTASTNSPRVNSTSFHNSSKR